MIPEFGVEERECSAIESWLADRGYGRTNLDPG